MHRFEGPLMPSQGTVFFVNFRVVHGVESNSIKSTVYADQRFYACRKFASLLGGSRFEKVEKKDQ